MTDGMLVDDDDNMYRRICWLVGSIKRLLVILETFMLKLLMVMLVVDLMVIL